LRIARVIVGLGFTGMFALVMWLTIFDLPFEARVDCDRAAGDCRVTHRLLTKTRSATVPVRSLITAQVRIVRARRGQRTIVYLNSLTGPQYIADYGTGGRAQAEADAAQLNQFINGLRPQVSITRSDAWMYRLIWVLLIGCLAMLAMLWWALLRKQPEPRPMATSSSM
jgi:hypothetical protein